MIAIEITDKNPSTISCNQNIPPARVQNTKFTSKRKPQTFSYHKNESLMTIGYCRKANSQTLIRFRIFTGIEDFDSPLKFKF